MANDTLLDRTLATISDESAPTIYANGFAVALTNADVHLVLQLSGKPVTHLHISFTLAKTLHSQLALVMAQFESRTGRVMLRTDEIDAVFQNPDIK